ncbi:putative nuclease HARBI1 [Nymphon striatum]|nr:putative nuclease HARBI1 [Nymphon striatum]
MVKTKQIRHLVYMKADSETPSIRFYAKTAVKVMEKLRDVVITSTTTLFLTRIEDDTGVTVRQMKDMPTYNVLLGDILLGKELKEFETELSPKLGGIFAEENDLQIYFQQDAKTAPIAFIAKTAQEVLDRVREYKVTAKTKLLLSRTEGEKVTPTPPASKEALHDVSEKDSQETDNGMHNFSSLEEALEMVDYEGSSSEKDSEDSQLLQNSYLLPRDDKFIKKFNATEIWHYPETLTYSPTSEGLFSDYINCFLKLKEQASGYPTTCVTESDKAAYKQAYYETEGVELGEMDRNEAAETAPVFGNVPVAALTTAYARLHLYSVIENLGEQLLYFDTDSVIYIERKGEWSPATGPFLGDLKDEILGDAIIEYAAAGPKNYAYNTRNGKVRGITLNHDNDKLINLQKIKALIDDHQKYVDVPETKFIRNKKDFSIRTVESSKSSAVIPPVICRTYAHILSYLESSILYHPSKAFALAIATTFFARFIHSLYLAYHKLPSSLSEHPTRRPPLVLLFAPGPSGEHDEKSGEDKPSSSSSADSTPPLEPKTIEKKHVKPVNTRHIRQFKHTHAKNAGDLEAMEQDAADQPIDVDDIEPDKAKRTKDKKLSLPCANYIEYDVIYDVDVGRRHEKERVDRHLELDYDEQEFRGNVGIDFGTGSPMKVIGDTMGYHISSVSGAVRDVSGALCQVANQFINWPTLAAEKKNRIKQGFYEIAHFPGVIGAIECTHVRLQSPSGGNEYAYVHRKGFHPINMQGVCDHRG